MAEKEEIQIPDTLAYWNAWAHVAPGMLKRISGGSLNGMSDINPVWRFQALTEAFGPCGFGWRIREVERWTHEAAGEVAAFVKVEIYINIGGTWSEPVEGTGGSKLVRRDKNGTSLSDEAWKMATTDAISVACKSLGLAADVYTGRQSHSDPDQKADGPDQKADGPDYGTKYESRNYGQDWPRNGRAGSYPTQGQRAQNKPQSGPPAGQYGPGPVYASSGAPAPAPAPAAPGRFRISMDVVLANRCRGIITALSQRDYDDQADWGAGVQSILEKYDVDPDALQEIQGRAVAEKEARLQKRVPQMEDLPV